MTHTPTPWITDGVVIHPKGQPGSVVAATVNANSTMYVSTIKDWAEQNSNAEFIVRAANCHDEMLAALQCAIDFMEGEDLDELHGDLGEVIRAAIANAKGRCECEAEGGCGWPATCDVCESEMKKGEPK